MNVYATESIRNVVLLGHGGCGKTSLIESMGVRYGFEEEKELEIAGAD